MTPKPKPTPETSESARVDPNPEIQSDNGASHFQHPPAMPFPPLFDPAQWQGWYDPNAFPPHMGPPHMMAMDQPDPSDLSASAPSFHPGGAPSSAPAPGLPHHPTMLAPPPPSGPPPPSFAPMGMPVPYPEGFCPPIGQMMPPPSPPMPMPASGSIEQVGILGGIHYHYQVNMQDLVRLLENTQIKAKKEAIVEYTRQVEEKEEKEEEPTKAESEQTELLQQVLGYVKGIHEQQENQKLREEETKRDNQQLHAMMKEMLEQLKEIKSQLVNERSQDMEEMLEKTQVILDHLGSSRELELSVARVLPIVSSAVETTTEIGVQQQKDSVVLIKILDQQTKLNKFIFDALNSRQNPNKNGKKSGNSNNQSKRGFGRHGQENRAP